MMKKKIVKEILKDKGYTIEVDSTIEKICGNYFN